MSRLFFVVFALGRLCAIAGFGVVLLSGCSYFRSSKDYDTLNVAPETLRQIDTLALEEAEEEEAPKPDSDKEEISTPDSEKPVPAELVISLEECRALALENNLDLKVKLINPAIAAERVSEQEAKFESAFSANVEYTKTIQSPESQLQSSNFERANTALGVSIPLRTGGTVSFNLTDNQVEQDNPFYPDITYSSNLSASISQPLLRNAGKRASTYSIRIAEYERQISDAQTKLEAILLIADVDSTYWRLYGRRRLLDVRKQQHELAKTTFEQTQRFVEVGVKPQIELIRTRAQVAEQFELIIQADNNVRDAERDLKRKLNKAGLGMETATVLVPSTEPDPVHYNINREQIVAEAIENRIDLLELELQIAQAAAKIDYQRNQTLPDLKMDYRYNISGRGFSRSDSYDVLSDNDYKGHYVGLNVSIPLGNKAAKSRLRQAKYEHARQLAGRDNKEALIKSEVLKQIDTLEANWQSILACRQWTVYQDQQYQAEKRQFELGLVTSKEVLDAQTKLADAQQSEIVALTEYQITLVELAKATGMLLGAAKVRWEPMVPQE